MNNEMTVYGSWYCGAVKINGTVLADMFVACHFTDCQKFIGTPCCAVAVMFAKQVAIFGAVKDF